LSSITEVYFRAKQLFQAENKPLKAALVDEFGVSYDTALRYMTFTALLKRYPLLMICGLTYAQITKHKKRLLDFLKTETEGLGDKLSQPLDLFAEGKNLHIEPADHQVPATSFTTDPDHLYGVYSEVEDTPQMEEWAAETAGVMFWENNDDNAAMVELMDSLDTLRTQ